MLDFEYTMFSAHVVFGRGTIERLPSIAEGLGGRRILVLSTPEQTALAERVAGSLGDRSVGIFGEARMHTPVDVTERAMTVVADRAADLIVATGGGSTTGLGKAIALRSGLPVVALPTTYAGSEMTAVLGETRDGLKTTLTDPAVRPRAVIYDVDLTDTLPVGMSVVSGLNAMAHSVEALYAEKGNPVVTLFARQSITALAGGMRALVADPDDGEARSQLLYGAWLAGTCLGLVGMALHHKLCHVLGGTFDLPHAQTHAVVLPHAVAYNSSHAGRAMADLARALGVSDPVAGLFDLARDVGAPTRLADLGMPRDGIEKAAGLAVRNAYWNPREITLDGMRTLLANAFDGRRPD